jgi:uncharacterized protein YdcH (DUF465 family)
MPKYSDEWTAAKDEYYNLTGDKKAKDKKFANLFDTSHKKLLDAIAKVDVALDMPEGTAKQSDQEVKVLREEKLKKFKSAVAGFKSGSSDYLSLLGKNIEEEKKNTVKAVPNNTETGEAYSAKVTTARLKGLKVLKTKLELWKAAFDSQISLRESMIKGFGPRERIQATFKEGLKTAFKTALAASAAIKANPTVDNWNNQMESTGVRSVTTALKAFKQLKDLYEKDGLGVPDDIRNDVDKANTWITKLTPWASGNKQKLVATDNPDIVVELKAAMVEVKACMEAFKAYL